MINGARQQLICNKGLTLVELMVATILLLVIIVSVGTVFINGQNSFYFLEGSANNVQEARIAADQASRDIRTAITVITAGNNSFTFDGDYDGNGVKEEITYARSSANFTRVIGTVTRTIATGLANDVTSEPIFQYFDQDGNKIIDLVNNKANIRLVTLDFKIDNDTGKSPKRSTQIVTRIQLRNLHERR